MVESIHGSRRVGSGWVMIRHFQWVGLARVRYPKMRNTVARMSEQLQSLSLWVVEVVDWWPWIQAVLSITCCDSQENTLWFLKCLLCIRACCWFVVRVCNILINIDILSNCELGLALSWNAVFVVLDWVTGTVGWIGLGQGIWTDPCRSLDSNG